MVQLVLTGPIAGSILTGTSQVGMVYAFSLAFGTVAGFFTPGSNSMGVLELITTDGGWPPDRHAAAQRNLFNRFLGCLYDWLQTQPAFR